MDWENEWLTKQDIQVAKANGISYKTLYQRVYNYGWDVERAITEPPRQRVSQRWLNHKDICKEHGVTNLVFNTRVTHGWDPMRAATTPHMTQEDRNRARAEKWELEKPDSLRLAEENGISYKVWYRRMQLGWDPMDAATVPVGSKGIKNRPGGKHSINK